MELITKAPRGTVDILPQQSKKWQYVEETIRKTVNLFGYEEIRFPTFEHTELFARGVGDNTDIVQKEMYTFADKGDRSITLRPEGTAGAVRLMLENGLYAGLLPLKIYYLISCFRYEKPQAGRLREFHQFGVEVFGTQSPFADAEVISLANQVITALGICEISLEINSIGCKECRKRYYDALKQYLAVQRTSLCNTCNERIEKNPMRILDCKSEICSGITKNAPVITAYICEDCQNHFSAVKQALDAMQIRYSINPRIVRGLDYYNKTVFEFVSTKIGAQGTVCGGGRYDGLAKELGGEDICGLGFGMGLERIIMLMENENHSFGESEKCKVFLANIGQNGANKAMSLVAELRRSKVLAMCDISGKSLKAQMKYADKIGAEYTVVLGDTEIETGKIQLKNMQSGDTELMDINALLKKWMDE